MSKSTRLELAWLESELAVCRLAADTNVQLPASEALVSLTRTPEETSLVCAWAERPDGARTEGPFRAFRVVGTLDFSLVGILSDLTLQLTAAQISVFVISTFDTDYVLVPAERAAAAAVSLRLAGHHLPDPFA